METGAQLTVTRSSYIADRPLSTTIVLENVASRQWMALKECTYLLGDGKAVASRELAGIANRVYESMMRTRVDSGVSLSTLDFGTFQKDIDDFNNRVAAWGDHWQATFASCKRVPQESRETSDIIQFLIQSLPKHL